MDTLEQIKRPSKQEQKVAGKSYNTLSAALAQINSVQTEIEIEETKEKIQVPLRALKLLSNILKAMGEGKPISIVPVATEVTCSCCNGSYHSKGIRDFGLLKASFNKAIGARRD